MSFWKPWLFFFTPPLNLSKAMIGTTQINTAASYTKSSCFRWNETDFCLFTGLWGSDQNFTNTRFLDRLSCTADAKLQRSQLKPVTISGGGWYSVYIYSSTGTRETLYGNCTSRSSFITNHFFLLVSNVVLKCLILLLGCENKRRNKNFPVVFH